jgi:hypothetical protein
MCIKRGLRNGSQRFREIFLSTSVGTSASEKLVLFTLYFCPLLLSECSTRSKTVGLRLKGIIVSSSLSNDYLEYNRGAYCVILPVVES